MKFKYDHTIEEKDENGVTIMRNSIRPSEIKIEVYDRNYKPVGRAVLANVRIETLEQYEEYKKSIQSRIWIIYYKPYKVKVYTLLHLWEMVSIMTKLT